MTTYNHTAITIGAAANAATFNSPLGQLDAAIKLNKFDATTAPTSSNDVNQGYTVGSRWVDVTNDQVYTCVDATAGAAIWELTATRTMFMALNSATDTDVTGDGTGAMIDFNSETFDIGGNFASDTFTAPVDGKYLFTVSAQLDQLAAGHTTGYLLIVTSNRSYLRALCNPYACSSGGSLQLMAAVIADMEAGDTAYVEVYVFGSTKVVDVYGGSGSTRTQFAGALLM